MYALYLPFYQPIVLLEYLKSSIHLTVKRKVQILSRILFFAFSFFVCLLLVRRASTLFRSKYKESTFLIHGFTFIVKVSEWVRALRHYCVMFRVFFYFHHNEIWESDISINFHEHADTDGQNKNWRNIVNGGILISARISTLAWLPSFPFRVECPK
jgi:hypothetical protein